MAWQTRSGIAGISPFSLCLEVARLQTSAAGRLAPLLYYCHTGYMKTTLNVSRRGVVTLPAKLRQALGIKGNDQIIAEATPEGLLLRPAVTLPIEMYSDKRIREFEEAEAELERVLRRKKKARSAR